MTLASSKEGVKSLHNDNFTYNLKNVLLLQEHLKSLSTQEIIENP